MKVPLIVGMAWGLLYVIVAGHQAHSTEALIVDALVNAVIGFVVALAVRWGYRKMRAA